MQHCSTLNEYAQYVARVRHYATDMPLNQAVERAVDECIQKGILTEFLTRNRNEVISMSIFEYEPMLRSIVKLNFLHLIYLVGFLHFL